MADVQPLRALHYDPAGRRRSQAVVAPPYDVIDPEQRAALAARSPYNVVAIDLPEASRGRRPLRARRRAASSAGRPRAPSSATTSPRSGRSSRTTPAPTAARSPAAASSRACASRTTAPAGSARTSARTPARKEDRLRLTRATKANLSPIFSLYDDPQRRRLGRARAGHRAASRWARPPTTTARVNRLWRVADPDAIAAVQAALADAELLIADGHHRYETARVYADEIGGEGEHRYVLMCLVALEDPGLTVFPTHRLIRDTTPQTQEALAGTLRARLRHRADRARRAAPARRRRAARPWATSTPHFKRGLPAHAARTRRSPTRALDDMPEAYRHLDTAVLEALLLKGPLGLTDDDIDHLQRPRLRAHRRGGARARALAARTTPRSSCARRPVEQVQRDRRGGRQHAPEVDVLLPQGPDRAAVQSAAITAVDNSVQNVSATRA